MSDILFDLYRIAKEFPPLPKYRYAYMGRNQYAELCEKMPPRDVRRDGNIIEANLDGLQVFVFPTDDFGPILSEKRWDALYGKEFPE